MLPRGFPRKTGDHSNASSR